MGILKDLHDIFFTIRAGDVVDCMHFGRQMIAMIVSDRQFSQYLNTLPAGVDMGKWEIVTKYPGEIFETAKTDEVDRAFIFMVKPELGHAVDWDIEWGVRSVSKLWEF